MKSFDLLVEKEGWMTSHPSLFQWHKILSSVQYCAVLYSLLFPFKATEKRSYTGTTESFLKLLLFAQLEEVESLHALAVSQGCIKKIFSCPCDSPFLVGLDGLPSDLSIIKDFFFVQNRKSEHFEYF
jgi:hypothetical protein